jgi:large subunit ribosomal protein L21
MYCIVEVQGHQYLVKKGDKIDVEKLEGEAGKTVEFDKVLFVGGSKVAVGAPTVSGAKVVAKIVRTDRSRKVWVLKRAPGKYRKKNGHRQPFTCIEITDIKA